MVDPTAKEGIDNVLSRITPKLRKCLEGTADTGDVQVLIAYELDLMNQLKFAEMELIHGSYDKW